MALNAKYQDESNPFRQGFNTATKNCSEGVEAATNYAKQLYADALKDGKERCDTFYLKAYSDGFKKESSSLGRSDGLLPQSNVDRWDDRLSQWKKDCTAEFSS